MRQLKLLRWILICLILGGCFDLFERTYWSDNSYYVTNDPGANYKTLYITDGEHSIGRIKNISRINSNDMFIIAESTTNYTKQYWVIDKNKDQISYNADQIVEGPFTFKNFNDTIQSKGIKDLQLKFNLE